MTSELLSLPAVNEKQAGRAGLKYVTDEMPGLARQRRGKEFIYQKVNGKPVRDPATLQRIGHLAIPPA